MLLEDRFLLFIDILGFSELVRTQGQTEVFNTIKACLDESRGWVDGENFARLHFSDTLVIYSRESGFDQTFWDDFVAIASRMFVALAARKIPTRSTLAFGPFMVQRDAQTQHDIFFGKALVEAAETEESTQFIGTALCPSFVPKHSERYVAHLQETGLLGQLDDGRYYVNPFRHLQHWPDPEWIDSYALEFPGRLHKSPEDTYLVEQELLALDFLQTQEHVPLPDEVRRKYQRTMDFFRRVLRSGALEWAQEAISGLKADKR
jgi:hypothetical protein